jgi:hypothetical protein
MYGVASQTTEGDGVQVPTAPSSTTLGHAGQRRNIKHQRTVPITALCGKTDVRACQNNMCRFRSSICAVRAFPFHAFSHVLVSCSRTKCTNFVGKANGGRAKSFCYMPIL